MRHSYTHISMLIDRSGSMAKVCDDTIGGINTFLTEQRKVAGTATVSLATFASDYTLIHDFVPLEQVGDLTNKTYKPAGFTALLDSVGKLVDDTGTKLHKMQENERPSQVLFLIVSDGEENRSKEFTRSQIFDTISHQRNKYNWNFIYIGCSQDQIQEAANLGISTKNVALYDQTKAGSRRMFKSISENTASYRISGEQQNNFFDQGNSATSDHIINISSLKTPKN